MLKREFKDWGTRRKIYLIILLFETKVSTQFEKILKIMLGVAERT